MYGQSASPPLVNPLMHLELHCDRLAGHLPLSIADRSPVGELMLEADADATLLLALGELMGLDRPLAELAALCERAQPEAGGNDSLVSVHARIARPGDRYHLLIRRMAAERLAGGLRQPMATLSVQDD